LHARATYNIPTDVGMLQYMVQGVNETASTADPNPQPEAQAVPDPEGRSSVRWESARRVIGVPLADPD